MNNSPQIGHDPRSARLVRIWTPTALPYGMASRVGHPGSARRIAPVEPRTSTVRWSSSGELCPCRSVVEMEFRGVGAKQASTTQAAMVDTWTVLSSDA